MHSSLSPKPGISRTKRESEDASAEVIAVRFYPFFWGTPTSTGRPRPRLQFQPAPARKSGGEAFLDALQGAFRRIRSFAPDALVVALGLDAFEGDPFGGLSVSTHGFARIGEAIAGLGLPTVIVQEGGYRCDALGANLTSFLTGFGNSHRP